MEVKVKEVYGFFDILEIYNAYTGQLLYTYMAIPIEQLN